MAASANALGMRYRKTLHEGHIESPSNQDAALRGHPKPPPGKEEISCLTWMLLLFLFYFSIYSLTVFHFGNLPAPKIRSESEPHEFIEDNARQHLENIVKIGGRPAGSYENDIYTVKYILKTVSEIKKTSDKSKKIEADIQRPTGSFTLAFLDDFTSYYSNISNTVVRVSSPSSSHHALLLNCHTDSAINGPGASDDAVACAIMLEILRAVAVDNTPLIHPLILLFNGAEENILQASHGFITQHKWAKQVQAFINLEAAGAGGKEMVFQTGPENPWLVWAWAKNAPHPHGSSVGQDLFQSGLIPSDTDFRIYRDYGKIPGIDLAYTQNGYVYHTIHDSVDKIHPGCIQRAGDNILGVVQHLVQSPDSLLADPSAYSHGCAAFFDFLGLFFAVIPMRLLTIVNWCSILSVMAYIGKRMLHPKITGYTGMAYNSILLKVMAVNILGYIGCILPPALVAGLLTVSGRSKSWYSHPGLIPGLYLPPALMGLVTVHYMAKRTIFKNEDPKKLECVFFDAVLIIWTSMLYLARNVGSSYTFLAFTLSAVVGRGLLLHNYFDPKSTGNSGPKKLAVYLSTLSVASMLWIAKGCMAFWFFVPIAGRSGTDLPPEILMFGLVVIYTISCFSFQIGTVYLVDSLKWFYIILTVALTCSLAVAFSSFGFPYSGNPTNPIPKRVYIQHTSREFYNMDGQLERSDSGMFVNYLDYTRADNHLGPDILMQDEIYPCKGSFCEMPYIIPIQKLARKFQYIPVPAPPKSLTDDKYPLTVKWERSEILFEKGIHYIKIHASVNGPPHMSLHITPVNQGSASSTLDQWSFDGDVNLAHSTDGDAETYFVFYGGGLVHPVWEFWLQFAVTTTEDQVTDTPVVELAVICHYTPSGTVSKVNHQSSELEELTSQLEDWVSPMTWVSLYRKYII